MSAVVRHADDLAWVDDDERVVVVRLADPAADPLVLAGSAAVVWRAIGDGPGRRSEEVVAEVAAAYDLDPDVVADDVRSLLHDALGWGILRAE